MNIYRFLGFDTKRPLVFLSTINLVLCLVGYQFFTSVFLPASSNVEDISRTVTIPFRAAALLIMIIVTAAGLTKPIPKLPVPLKWLFFYWFAFICKIFFDLKIKTDFDFLDGSQIWLFIFGICLPMAFSVVLSYSLIDWKMAFNWTYFLIAVTLGISLFSNESLWITTVEVQRPDANVALNTISFGHLGATGTILSLYCFGKMKLGVLNKIVVIVVMALSIYCMLRAASRGPVIAFAIVSLFWMICRFRRLSLGLTIITCTMALIIVFLDPIISVLGEISPILEMRLRDNNDSTTRFPIYSAAINAFLDNPITGKQFVVFFGGTTYAYPHNIVLEAFMALGLLGGVILVYILVSAFKVCYLTVHSSREDYWISLILIQQTAALFFSGTFYEDQVLSALLAYVFMAHYRPITRKTILNAI